MVQTFFLIFSYRISFVATCDHWPFFFSCLQEESRFVFSRNEVSPELPFPKAEPTQFSWAVCWGQGLQCPDHLGDHPLDSHWEADVFFFLVGKGPNTKTGRSPNAFSQVLHRGQWSLSLTWLLHKKTIISLPLHLFQFRLNCPFSACIYCLYNKECYHHESWWGFWSTL